MNAAVRILREELHWLQVAALRLSGEVVKPAVPTDLVLDQLNSVRGEISEVEEALECLTCDVGQPFQPSLPFVGPPPPGLSRLTAS